MKNTWRHYLRRIATAGVVSGATMWSSAMCYAVTASDNADNAPYTGGTGDWDDGDNGGTGFNAWDFSSSLTFGGEYFGQYTMSDFHAIDDGDQSGTHYSNPFNSLGPGNAWAMGHSPTNNGTVRAGRGFVPLGIGQTIRVTFDNPTDQAYYKGYFIELNSASRTDGNGRGLDGSLCYGGYACTDPFTNVVSEKMRFQMFHFGAGYGQWRVVDQTGGGLTGVMDTDTTATGAVFSVERTAADTYTATLDPIGPDPPVVIPNRTFSNAGLDLNWIEFTMFSTPTDTTPNNPPGEPQTDWYIRSVEILDPVAAGVAGDYNDDGTVNAADYVTWRKNEGTNNVLPNDPIGGTIDGDQYTQWRRNFGETGGGGSGLGGGAVPEPSTFVYLVMGAVGLGAVALGRRREGAVVTVVASK